MKTIGNAILLINPNAKAIVHGDNIDTCEITWIDNNPTNITKEQIKAKINETAYMDKRANEYPSMADQLDDIFHNGIDGWKATIQAIKDKYPKE